MKIPDNKNIDISNKIIYNKINFDKKENKNGE